MKNVLKVLPILALVSWFAGAQARADQRDPAAVDDLNIGTELLALEDVHIARADINKGAKLTVTSRKLREGQLESVDIALADGYVVKKVSVPTIRAYFRVLGDR